jgi:hypothetical protein
MSEADTTSKTVQWNQIGLGIHARITSMTSLAKPMERFEMDPPFPLINRLPTTSTVKADRVEPAGNVGVSIEDWIVPDDNADEETVDMVEASLDAIRQTVSSSYPGANASGAAGRVRVYRPTRIRGPGENRSPKRS